MPSEITYNRGDFVSRKTYWLPNPCEGPPTSPVSSEKILGYRVRNTIDHTGRARPSKPLFLHPTSMGTQSTTEVQYKQTQAPPWVSYTYPCEAGVSTEWTVDSTLHAASLPFDENLFPSPDWALPLRLRIADLDIDIGTDIVEYRQTVKMLNSFSRGAKAAWNIYRGRLPRKIRNFVHPCNVAAAELTYSYGIEPLAGTLYDSAMRLSERLESPLWKRTSVSVSDSTGTEYGEYRSSVKAVCYVQADSSDSGFTLGNPLSLAWEVIPFSFVIDWGIGVGDYLKALSATYGVTYAGVSVSTFHNASLSDSSVSPGHELLQAGSLNYKAFSRTAPGTIAMPRGPKIGFKSSFRQLAHATSLLTVLNHRCK